MTGSKKREDEFLAKTGIKRSRAGTTKVLSFLSDRGCPHGFDHTRVYYSPDDRCHILITEPYHSADEALESLYRMAGIGGYSGDIAHVVGREGAGLWNPGECVPLFVGRSDTQELLQFLAENLRIKTQHTN